MSTADEDIKSPSSASKKSPAPRKNRRRRKPLKVANQLSLKRRKEIEKAFEKKSPSPKKWSRESGPKTHLFDRKRIKPGSIRKIDFNLLDVEIGDSVRVMECRPLSKTVSFCVVEMTGGDE